jgi:hypothetical protein
MGVLAKTDEIFRSAGAGGGFNLFKSYRVLVHLLPHSL